MHELQHDIHINQRPRLALTLGDPAGIGPEVVLKALADPNLTRNSRITVIGSKAQLRRVYAQFKARHDQVANPDEFDTLDIDIEDTNIIPGIGNAASGAASFAYLETAISRTKSGEFQGIVTGPIAKSAWKAAGYNYPGQTELLAQRAGVTCYGMLFVARSPHTNWTMRTLLATTHIPLREVANTLTPQLLATKLDLLVECLQHDFCITTPTIAIAGLNPHSGESGQLGREEQDWLIPWLEKERCHRPHIQLVGPIPPDTMWVKPAQAWYGNAPTPAADGYLALYHDQGLIPVKQLAFDRAVNTSIGLPFVRTSPDHGTAFDIAGKAMADATSMKAAIQLAIELTHRRMATVVTA